MHACLHACDYILHVHEVLSALPVVRSANTTVLKAICPYAEVPAYLCATLHAFRHYAYWSTISLCLHAYHV